ncbi:hypothetical protein B0T21DRAFT_429889 [Apiosordaria backusii]|uniref:RING-type domain-containing protein n=1 Tax=Apiosordaria backusii TaxID=314023 RepID=A0AA40ESZ4_9PEZI|nr:hypothetical protein B0T21DRAFT_429889 [Apiosordaria backusii]
MSNRRELTLFHHLRKYLLLSARSKSRRPIPLIKCNICRSDQFEITTPATPVEIVSSSPIPEGDESLSCQTGIVLPCGHMFHYDCWTPYPEMFLPDRPVYCPACHFRLVFSSFAEDKCEHMCETYELPDVITHPPPKWERVMKRIPKTKGEVEEGEVFDLGRMCNGCRLESAEGMVRFIVEMRERLRDVSGAENMTYWLGLRGWDADEIDLAYPGWREGEGTVQGVRDEPGFGEEEGFVLGNLRTVLREEGDTWMGRKPPPLERERRRTVGGGMRLWRNEDEDDE